jgi:hypothetical protein
LTSLRAASSGDLIRLGRSATAPSRHKGLASLSDPGIAHYGGEVHTEQASCSGLGHTFFDGSDDPDSQIFRIRLYAYTLLGHAFEIHENVLGAEHPETAPSDAGMGESPLVTS